MRLNCCHGVKLTLSQAVVLSLDQKQNATAGEHEKMSALHDVGQAPSQLQDVLDRTDRAKELYVSLVREMDEFLYHYVEGMVKGRDPETGNFVLWLRHPRDSVVHGQPRVLVTEIVENLRSALDYMVFQLSVLNEPDLNKRVPQFVVSATEADFESQSRSRLRYLTDEQKDFVRRIQPYQGNWVLGLLGEMAGSSKHRGLLSVRGHTGFDIYFADITKVDDYQGFFMYPVEEGQAFFARPKDKQAILLMEKYDALPTLKAMIKHTADIIRISYCFFQGRPLSLTIVQS